MGKRLISQIVLFTLLAQMLAPFAPQGASASVSDLDRSLLNPASNVLTNPGFEASRAAWTASGGTLTTVAKSSAPANVDAGSASGSWDSSAASQTLTTAFQTVTSGDGFSGQPGVVSCRFKCSTGTCTHTLTAYNGSSNIKTPVTIVSSSAFVRQSLNFPYPGSGTVALRVTSVNSNEPTLYVDSCYMGLAEGFNIFIGTTSNSPAKAGFISPTAATSCPAGWLDADGTAVSRTTYPNYFTNVGTTYGVGDGSTTVNLPDGRGVFLRGAGSQTISGTGYTGTQGTTQGDQFQGHWHQLFQNNNSTAGAANVGIAAITTGGNNSSWAADSVRQPISDGTNGTPRAGTETRPANISVKYCVKMFDDQSNSFFRPEAGGLAPGEESITSATSCPLGTIPEDGASVLRASYPELFAAIGTVYGSVDGTHFNVPDHRGVFERGAGTQTISAINYTGTQGTTQGDQAQGHKHAVSDPGHTHSVTYVGGAANNSPATPQGTSGGINATSYNTSSNTTGLTVQNPTTDGTNGTPRTGSETRPANISHLHCIRYLAGPPNPVSASSSSTTASTSVSNYITTNAGIEDTVFSGYSLGTVTLTNGLPTGVPTFGSGASGNLSLAVETSSPVSGLRSLNYVSSAATTAGNFVATDAFSVDQEGRAKALRFSISYKALSGGTNVNYSGTSSNSYGVALYDATNSSWIGCSGTFNVITGTGVGAATGTCQTNSTTASARLVWYNVSATAGAVTMTLDNFLYGPFPASSAPTSVSPAVLAFTAWSPSDLVGTLTNPSTATATLVGNSGVTFTTNGTATPIVSATALTAGTAQVNFSEVGWYLVSVTGSAAYANATTDADMPIAYGGTATRYENSSTFHPFILGVNTFDASGTDTYYVNATASGQTLTINPKYRASGGGSTGQRVANARVSVKKLTSTEATGDGRVVGAIINGAPQTTYTANTPIRFSTAVKDTHSGWDPVNGEYRVPETGFYDIEAAINCNAANGSQLYAAVNGVTQDPFMGTSNNTGYLYGSTTVYANAGSLITVRYQGTWTGVSGSNGLTIMKVSGSTAVSPTDKISAKYNNLNGVSSIGTDVSFIYKTRVWDSHGAYDTTTGAFRAPRTGRYRVTHSYYGSGNNYSYVSVNGGTETARLGLSTQVGAPFSTVVSVNAGDTLSVKSAGAHTVGADGPAYNYVIFEEAP